MTSGLGVAAGLGKFVGVEGIVSGFTLGVLSATIGLGSRWWQRTSPECMEQAVQATPQTFWQGVTSVFCCRCRGDHSIRIQGGKVYSPMSQQSFDAGEPMDSPVSEEAKVP